MGDHSQNKVIIPYHPWKLAEILHRLPHVNTSFKDVDSKFEPESAVYLESLGILASVPAAWLIFTLFILLLYLLTRCCDRKPRQAASISALKITLAITSVLCCAAIGLGLYGNDDLHMGIVQTAQAARRADDLVHRIRNHTEAIERQLRVQAAKDFESIKDEIDAKAARNLTLLKKAEMHLNCLVGNNTLAANAAAEIRNPLLPLDLFPKIKMVEKVEVFRYPVTMSVLSVLLVLCVILLVGVARHSRCALIAFSVCGLLAVIASYLMASVYLASSVALGDFCMAPGKFIENQAKSELSREILRHYVNCEAARANPFTQRLREGRTALENMRADLSLLKTIATELYGRALDQKFQSLKSEINTADSISSTLTALVECKRSFYVYYTEGAYSLCYGGLLGLTLMLLSAVLSGLLLTILVWVDSHTWIYIRKKKDYHQVNEADPYLPPPQAGQAVAARTLQRSQGQFPHPPPETPPPSYSSAMIRPPSHVVATAPLMMHEADLLLTDGCDNRQSEHHRGAHLAHMRGHTLGRLPSHHHHNDQVGPNNGKYATLTKQCKTHACKDFPNFKFEHQQAAQKQQQQQQQQQMQVDGQSDGRQLPQHSQESLKTATLGKYSSLGRRPLPQTPDDKARAKQPPNAPKVPPTTVSSALAETPLNPNHFRSLQRGTWQESPSTFQPNVQFRSLQRGGHSAPMGHHAHVRGGVKIQEPPHHHQMQGGGEHVTYANNDNERQLYAVTEL